ncbi:putative gustatory receptor 28b [Sabethes cyaneus]|uniref:putative gustatory receptor 28b n=1 Tax=Sabethes cyaneus TaxID=53552 RepID=UPI00237E94FE|nr:putative gustatory receptor 28b [Sabethes cyaneus]
MRWFRVDDFFQSIRPVYLTARMFLLHFETVDFQRRTHRRTLLDQAGLALTFVMDLFLATVAFRNITVMLQMSDSVLLNLGYYVSFMLATMIALVIPSWNSWQAESIFEIYANIANVDDDLKQLGITIDHQKHHFVSTISPKFSSKSTEDTNHLGDIIRKLAALHDLLSDTVELFNRCFSIQAMLCMAPFFSFTVFSLFGLIHSYASRADNDTLQVSWSNMIYDMLPVYFMIQMVLCSGLVHAKCKQMAVLIHKAISCGAYNRKLLEELRAFIQQLEHHAPKISCRVFDFDWTLFFTMAGSLTTYLVILIQFDLVNFTKNSS